MRLAKRIVDILYCLQANGGGLGIKELAEKIELPKSTTHRLLRALEAHGFVAQDPIRQDYSLGLGLLALASAALQKRGILLGPSEKPMERLRDLSGETVCIHVPFGLERVCVKQIDSPHSIRYTMDLGKPMPLYCGAAGKALLAFMPEQVVDRVIQVTGLVPVGPNTITDPGELRHQLQMVRSRGYALSFEERTPLGATAAAPVRHENGSIIACVAVYGPRFRLTEERIVDLVPELLATAGEISRAIAPTAAH